MNETGGQLRAAIYLYLNERPKLTVGAIALIRIYLVQWIDSPVWDQNPDHTGETLVELDWLRRQAHSIATVGDIDRFLKQATAAGMDPL
jgi:hypothetical protein